MNAGLHVVEALGELEAAAGLLCYSMNAVGSLPEDVKVLGPGQLESVDAFTSRFGRLVDLLCNRVLRALDRYELQDPGTLLDVALRAEKRGLIPGADWLRELKDVRNRIAHDYAGERTGEILAFCRQQAPALVAACRAVDAYARQRVQQA